MPAHDPLLAVRRLLPDRRRVAVAVRTVVSPGSVSSRVRIESMIVSNDENDRPVAPGPPRRR